MKKTYKLLGGISGLLSGALGIAVCVAFFAFIGNGGIEDGSQALSLVILSIFIFPALIFEGIISLVILGLSIGILASKNKVYKRCISLWGYLKL